MYGNGKCKFDKSTGKFTNAKDPECGVGALMDFVDTVDTVKIAEGCATALTNYTTQELCAPLSSESERKYPWGCRNMGIAELQSTISSRASVYCPDDMDKTGKGLTDTKQVVKNSQVNQIRELNDADIQAKIAELKQELFNLRFQAAVGKLENTAQLRKVKKEIARAYTVLTERASKEA